jgi:hygromycin-B 4-O-kinase
MNVVNQGADAVLVHALLSEHIGDDVADVYPLAGGFFSRAFAAAAGGREYVARLNAGAHAAESFAKDDYAWRHFASPTLPIPRIVAIGETDNGCYAISERVPGCTLAELSVDERRTLLPAVLSAFETIGKVDVSMSWGYGPWGSSGDGQYPSWQQYLAAITTNDPEGYYQNWHALFRDSFLEREVYEAVYRRMLRLAEYCPEERALIHNDYQFENIMVARQRITGVIDWANALYGDPLYNVARWVWLSAQPGWWYDNGSDIIRSRFGDAPHYDERIACYQCHIGLDDLRFYAKNDNRAKYDIIHDYLLALVAAAPD